MLYRGAIQCGETESFRRSMIAEKVATQQFYRFVREERLFCATLAHLLMPEGAQPWKVSEAGQRQAAGGFTATDLPAGGGRGIPGIHLPARLLELARDHQ